MINETCYVPSTRVGAILVDVLLLGLIPIVIDVATSNLSYYEYVPGCDNDTGVVKQKKKKRKRKVVYEIEEDDDEDYDE